MICPLEIDMYNISGKYQDGKWHELIQTLVKNWVKSKQFGDKGTIWSSVQPSASFEDFTNACFITAFGMPGFMRYLEVKLCENFPRQVRGSDEMMFERGTWRPYLHLEHGKIWAISDEVEWKELN